MFSGEGKAHAGEGESIDTLIGEHTTVKGDVRFRGGLHVDGHIDGSVATADGQEGELTLSERGSIKGEVKVPVVVINGKVEGDILSSKRVELNTQARVNGNIRYRKIHMHLGSEVNGQLICEPETASISPVKSVTDSKSVSG